MRLHELQEGVRAYNVAEAQLAMHGVDCRNRQVLVPVSALGRQDVWWIEPSVTIGALTDEVFRFVPTGFPVVLAEGSPGRLRVSAPCGKVSSTHRNQVNGALGVAVVWCDEVLHALRANRADALIADLFRPRDARFSEDAILEAARSGELPGWSAELDAALGRDQKPAPTDTARGGLRVIPGGRDMTHGRRIDDDEQREAAPDAGLDGAPVRDDPRADE